MRVESTVRKFGGSFYVKLPPAFAAHLKVVPNTPVFLKDIEREGKPIIEVSR